MKPFSSKTLTTERLCMRPFRAEDAEAMFENWASDPDVARWMVWEAHESVAETKRLLGEWIALTPEDRHAEWCITLRGSDVPVGSIAAMTAPRDAEGLELGWCLSKSLWGQGLMPEAVRAVAEYLFNEAGIGTLYARHYAPNERSGRVMRKVGMRLWGDTMEEVGDMGPVPVCIYALKEGELK